MYIVWNTRVCLIKMLRTMIPKLSNSFILSLWSDSLWSSSFIMKKPLLFSIYISLNEKTNITYEHTSTHLHLNLVFIRLFNFFVNIRYLMLPRSFAGTAPFSLTQQISPLKLAWYNLIKCSWQWWRPKRPITTVSSNTIQTSPRNKIYLW